MSKCGQFWGRVLQTLGADTEAELSDIDEIESLIGLQTSGKNDLSEAHFQMPYDLVGDSIEKGLVEKLRIIKSLLKNPRKFEVENNKGEIGGPVVFVFGLCREKKKFSSVLCLCQNRTNFQTRPLQRKVRQHRSQRLRMLTR